MPIDEALHKVETKLTSSCKKNKYCTLKHTLKHSKRVMLSVKKLEAKLYKITLLNFLCV